MKETIKTIAIVIITILAIPWRVWAMTQILRFNTIVRDLHAAYGIPLMPNFETINLTRAMERNPHRAIAILGPLPISKFHELRMRRNRLAHAQLWL
jgi:hypothetical protein